MQTSKVLRNATEESMVLYLLASVTCKARVRGVSRSCPLEISLLRASDG